MFDGIWVKVTPLSPQIDESYSISDDVTVIESDIVSVVTAPLYLKKWDDSTSSYQQLCPEVFITEWMYMCTYV